MGFLGFGKKKNAETATPTAPVGFTEPSETPVTPSASQGIDLGKKSGSISLTKHSTVTIEKTKIIRATCEWSSNTDYDLYALVLLKDGRELVVSTFGSVSQNDPTASVLNGAVRHLGDVGRTKSGKAQETIEISLTDEIEAIVPVAYSAQSNGTGSFKRYGVSLGIDNGEGTKVTIDSAHASSHNNIYSVGIGVIRNTPNGVQIQSLEEYSKPGSENRPAFINGVFTMDAGARNLYK